MADQVDRCKSLTHDKYERLIKAAQAQSTIKVAVAHPCDDVSLECAVEAARLGLIEPILVGPAGRIRDVAKHAGLDIAAMEIGNSEHSHDFCGEGGRVGYRWARRGTHERAASTQTSWWERWYHGRRAFGRLVALATASLWMCRIARMH